MTTGAFLNNGSTKGWRERLEKRYVIPRGECLFRAYDLSAIPPDARTAALQVKVGQWSPFSDYGRFLVLADGYGLAWIWRKTAGMEPRRSTPIPETLLSARPEQGDKARLLRCKAGFEGQLWRGGILRASRWWPEQPDELAWNRFLRGAGGLATSQAESPTPSDATTLERPWARDATRSNAALASLGGNRAIVGLLLALAALLGWSTGGALRLHQRATDLEQHAETLKETVKPIREARQQAMAARLQVERLDILFQRRGQLELMAAVSSQMPARPDLKIVRWRFEADHVEFLVTGAGLDPKFFVRVLEGRPHFRNVRAQIDERLGGLVVQAEVSDRTNAEGTDGTG